MHGCYIHIPFCIKKCDYCDFLSQGLGEEALYFCALDKEIASRASKGIVLDTVYLGGGTPSSVEPRFIAQALNSLRHAFSFAPHAEITIECNPESVTLEKILAYKSLGINRVSLGIQSLIDKELGAVHRLHTAQTAIQSAHTIAQAGIQNLSCDIMLGLPSQTVSSLRQTLLQLFDLSLFTHISAYTLSIEDGTPLARTSYTVDDDLLADLYEETHTLLQAHGFMRYEVSNFCKEGFASLHNQKYWQAQNYLGLGLGAHGREGNTRYSNTRQMSDYLQEKFLVHTETLSPSELVKEIVMLGLRQTQGVDLIRLKAEFGYDLLSDKAQEIALLTKQNALKISHTHLKINPKFFLVAHSIISKLI